MPIHDPIRIRPSGWIFLIAGALYFQGKLAFDPDLSVADQWAEFAKFSASTGITTHTGSEFSAVGMGWQYRWGDGY
jgi:hypothetical protein